MDSWHYLNPFRELAHEPRGRGSGKELKAAAQLLSPGSAPMIELIYQQQQ